MNVTGLPGRSHDKGEANREELAQYSKRTIHNKYRGVTAVDPINEAEERN